LPLAFIKVYVVIVVFPSYSFKFFSNIFWEVLIAFYVMHQFRDLQFEKHRLASTGLV